MNLHLGDDEIQFSCGRDWAFASAVAYAEEVILEHLGSSKRAVCVALHGGRSAGCGVEEVSVFGYLLNHSFNLIEVVCPSQNNVASWVEATDRGKQLGALLLGELSAERVDSDVDGASISFKSENVGHDLCGRVAEGEAEGVKVLEVGPV